MVLDESPLSGALFTAAAEPSVLPPGKTLKVTQASQQEITATATPASVTQSASKPMAPAAM
jgi:hypothetical protein